MVTNGQLDETSAKIVQNLLDNGPRSSRKISEELQISHQTVRSKIKKMEKTGLIRNYTVDIDLSKLGHLKQDICIKLGDFNQKKVDKAITLVNSRPEVFYFAQGKGEYDFIIKTAAKDISRLLELEQELRNNLSEHIHIKRWNTTLIINEHKLKANSKILEMGKKETRKRDKLKKFNLLKKK